MNVALACVFANLFCPFWADFGRICPLDFFDAYAVAVQAENSRCKMPTCYGADTATLYMTLRVAAPPLSARLQSRLAPANAQNSALARIRQETPVAPGPMCVRCKPAVSKVVGCAKGAWDKTRLCITHGRGKHCQADGCTTGAELKTLIACRRTLAQGRCCTVRLWPVWLHRCVQTCHVKINSR